MSEGTCICIVGQGGGLNLLNCCTSELIGIFPFCGLSWVALLPEGEGSFFGGLYCIPGL